MSRAPAPKIIYVEGIPIKIVRKKIRNLYLRAKDGVALASAPLSLPVEEVAKFARRKIDWLRERLSRQHPPDPGDDWDSAAVWGRRLPATVHPFSSQSAVKAADGLIHIYCRGAADPADAARLLEAWRKRLLYPAARGLLDHWRQRLGVGEVELSLRKMRSRWGTCIPDRKKIILNSALARLGPACLELTVVHELLHLIEPNHGPRFKALLEQALPDWRERRKLFEAAPEVAPPTNSDEPPE